jgi:uncharacterized protein YggE
MARATRTLFIVPTALLSMLAVTACGDSGGGTPAAAQAPEPRNGEDVPVITVMGHGKVVGTPDVMTIRLGVQTGGETAQEALADNNQRAQNLVNVLKERGVQARDIQTSELSIYPTFDEKGLRITGYSAANIVTAKLRKIADAGPLIDAVAFAVGDAVRLQGISFSIDDTNDLIARARTDAVKKAMAQAKQLADGAGVELGDVRSIDETNDEEQRHLLEEDLAFAADSAHRVASAPVEAGSRDVVLDVKVVVEIEQ